MTLFGFNIGTFFNGSTDIANQNAQEIIGAAAVISVISVILNIIRWACVVIFVVSLILYFVRGGNVKKAEEEIRKQERLLKRLKKRENTDEDDLSDAEEDLGIAQEAYEQAVIARSSHAKRCRICVVWWVISFLITMLLTALVYKWGMNTAQSISDAVTFGNVGIDTLNTLGGGDDTEYDSSSVLQHQPSNYQPESGSNNTDIADGGLSAITENMSESEIRNVLTQDIYSMNEMYKTIANDRSVLDSQGVDVPELQDEIAYEYFEDDGGKLRYKTDYILDGGVEFNWFDYDLSTASFLAMFDTDGKSYEQFIQDLKDVPKGGLNWDTTFDGVAVRMSDGTMLDLTQDYGNVENIRIAVDNYCHDVNFYYQLKQKYECEDLIAYLEFELRR